MTISSTALGLTSPLFFDPRFLKNDRIDPPAPPLPPPPPPPPLFPVFLDPDNPAEDSNAARPECRPNDGLLEADALPPLPGTGGAFLVLGDTEGICSMLSEGLLRGEVSAGTLLGTGGSSEARGERLCSTRNPLALVLNTRASPRLAKLSASSPSSTSKQWSTADCSTYSNSAYRSKQDSNETPVCWFTENRLIRPPPSSPAGGTCTTATATQPTSRHLRCSCAPQTKICTSPVARI